MTTKIARAQIGHGEARCRGSRATEPVVDDEAVRAEKRQRLETLAALARNRTRR